MNDGFIKVTLGGKERSLKFNMRAMETFTEVKNQGIHIMSASVTLVYSGLIGWYYTKQIEVDFTFADVVDWVEELIFSNQQSVLSDIDKCFQGSKSYQYFKDRTKKLEAEAAKKKKSP